MSENQPQADDSTDASLADTKPSSRPEDIPAGAKSLRLPIVPGMITLLVIACIVAAFVWNGELEDAFGVPLDVINFIALFAVIGLMLLWVIWVVAMSRWKASTRMMAVAALFLVPYSIVKILNPVFGGDLTIVGFQPIWANAPEIPKADAETSADSVDLSVESPSDFVQFLGPSRNGKVTIDQQLELSKLSEDSILWKIPVGPAWSGTVARNGFMITMEQRQDQECVTCYRISDGELMWIYTHPARHQDAMNMGHVGPRSTPVIDGGRVYSMGALGNLACLDGSNGKPIWNVDLTEVLNLDLEETASGEFPAAGEANSKLEWGRSGSPLIHDGCVIVPGGGSNGGPFATLLAFDVMTGTLKWKGGDQMIGYGSPSLEVVDGVPQILLMAESRGMSFHPTTGNVLWSFERPGDSSSMANTSQMSAVGADHVLLTKGYPDGGGTLLQVSGDNGHWAVEKQWDNHRVLKTKLTSPVLHDGHAYSICNGFLECARLSDGKRIWKHRGRLGHGQLLLVSKQLVVQSEFGDLIVVQATSDGYNEVCRMKVLKGICWNTMCLTGDKLILRSNQEALCLKIPSK